MNMPRFLHFWRMTPAEMRSLRVDDYRRMCAYMLEVEEAERRAMERLHHG